jgi:hypothetical protein
MSAFKMQNYFSKILIVILLLGLVLPTFGVQAQTFESVDKGSSIKIPSFLKGEKGPAGTRTFGGLITQILSILLLVIGSLSVLFLIIGGFRYVTASGNEEAAEGAKRMIWNSVVGLVLVIMAFAIITIITNVLIKGKAGVLP